MLQVSVIIPTYNRISLLTKALDSVLCQTYSPLEVIVIDDASTDNTRSELESRYPQVRYACQTHQGVSAARNTGIKLARSEWIAFLDSDDAWWPYKLAEQVEALERHPGFLICHSDEIWIRNGRRMNPKKKHAKHGGWIFARCLPLCVISPSSVIIHRSVFESVGRFDESLPACEDYDLWLRICARYPVLYVDQPLVTKHSGHGDQLSRKYWGMDRFRIYALEKIINTGNLGPRNMALAREMLVAKLGIVLSGAKKRDNSELVRECENKLARYGIDAADIRPFQHKSALA